MASKTLNIALDENLLKEVDAVVAQELASRSEYFRRLALKDIRRRKEIKEIFDRGNALGRELGIKSEEEAMKFFGRK